MSVSRKTKAKCLRRAFHRDWHQISERLYSTSNQKYNSLFWRVTLGVNAIERIDKSYLWIRVLFCNTLRAAKPWNLALKDWEPTENDVWKRKADMENSKDPTEKILAKWLKICYIEGKKGERTKNKGQYWGIWGSY